MQQGGAPCPPGTRAMTQGAVGCCAPCSKGTRQATPGATTGPPRATTARRARPATPPPPSPPPCASRVAMTPSRARARPPARRAPATAPPRAPRARRARAARTRGSTARAPTARPAGSRRQNTRVDCACANCPAGGLAPPEHAGQLRVRQLPGQRACTPRRARRAAAPAAAGAPSTRTAYSAHAGFSQSCMRRSPGKEGTPQSG